MENKIVIIGAVDSGPAQILGYATCVTPPVRQANLHFQAVACRLGNRPVEKNKLSFVPLGRGAAKPAIATPVVGRLNIFQTAFA